MVSNMFDHVFYLPINAFSHFKHDILFSSGAFCKVVDDFSLCVNDFYHTFHVFRFVLLIIFVRLMCFFVRAMLF